MNLMTKASHEEVSDLNTIQDQTVFLEIENKLLKERLELSPTLPADVTYKYIVEEMLPDLIPDNIPNGAALHYNGCGGWCPECFQKEYCEMKKEFWPDL